MKLLLFLHRWLGVALCIFFLLWFPSGIGMMYWSYPEVTTADRLERSPAIDPERVLLSPNEAADRAGAPLPRQIRLNTFDGRPAYRFGGGGRGGGPATIVYADTGEQQVVVDEAMLDRVASRWTGRPASEATVMPLEDVDQWTIQTFRTASPLVKYAWPNGEHVYISEFTGEVIQYTTAASRLGAYLGPIPHWLYFTPLRKHGLAWTRVVVWSSLIGTIAAIIGIVVAIRLYSPEKKYRYAGQPSALPYKGQKRWHLILGLIFGVATATWAFSGMLSMNPVPGLTGGGPNGVRPAGGPAIPRALRGDADLSLLAERNPREALDKLAGLDVRELEYTSFNGEPIYLATLAGGDTRIVPLDGPARESFTAEEIMQVVREAAGDEGLRELRVLDKYDFYYLDRNRRRPLPVVLARLDDADDTRYYIDPATARVVSTYSSRNWVNRWAYHALHSLDFPWLYNNRPLWDIVVIAFMLGGTALSVTSLVLAWRVIGKKLTRMTPMNARAATLVLFLAFPAALNAQVPADPPPGWQPTPEAARPHETPYRQHTVTLVMAPDEGMEFKYRLAEGSAMVYSWTASAPLFFEMHSSPDTAPRFAEFFEKHDGRDYAHGSYLAPFAGIHGWYWENRTGREVRITLTASGFFNETLEFRSGRPVQVTPVP